MNLNKSNKGQVAGFIYGLIFLGLVIVILPMLSTLMNLGTIHIMSDQSVPIETRLFIFLLPTIIIFLAVLFVWRLIR